MKITERIFHLENELAHNPESPTIIVPVGALKTLIRHHRKYTELYEKMNKYRTDARWYEEAYLSAKKESDDLKERVDFLEYTQAKTSVRSGSRWTTEEDVIILTAMKRNQSPKAITNLLSGRTRSAVLSRYYHLKS